MLGWEVIPRIPLGNLSVSPHGVGIAAGYFIGATLMARRARKNGFDEDHAWNAAVVGILGAIVGARVAYVIGHSNQFNDPIEYLQIYKGGISLMGGLIGGFLAAWLYCRAKKLDFVRLADMGAAGLAIGTAIGRIGDLVIGDHLGRTTDGFWGWEYQGGELISAPPCDTSVYPSADGCIEPGMVVHQTALYDSIWALIIFLVILRLERQPRPKGFLVLTWAAMYSVGRILTDLTRVDKTWFGTGLTGSQLTAIAVLLLSLILLSRLRRKPKVPAVAAGIDAGTTQAGTAGAEDQETVAAPGGAAMAEPAPEGAEADADEADAVPEPASAEPAETVVVVETLEEPPAGVDETSPAGDEPLVAVEPVSPLAPEAAQPVTSSVEEETVAAEPEAGAEPVEILFTDSEPAPEVTGDEPAVEPEAGAEPVEVLVSDGEPPAEPASEPGAAPAEPVETLRETVAAVDAAEAVVVEAAVPAEASDQEVSDSLLAEEPVGAEAIDAMPLSDTADPAAKEPSAAPAAESAEGDEIGPAATEPPENQKASPATGGSPEGRQEP
jgi:phosphatidylglycerol---prolipoprotein diacylglyceryl transferase